VRRSLLTGAILLIACEAEVPPQGDTTAQAPSWAVPPSQHNLTCTPERLRRGDVLTLHMTQPHGASLYAVAPDTALYVIVFHGEGRPDLTQRRSLMPPDSFATVNELRLPVRTQTAGVWVFGRDTNELLFRKPGMYRVIVGTDLQTDGPVYAECHVRYVP